MIVETQDAKMTNELSKRVRLIPSAPAGRMVRSRKSTSTVNVNSQRQQSASEYTYQLILTSRS